MGGAYCLGCPEWFEHDGAGNTWLCPDCDGEMSRCFEPRLRSLGRAGALVYSLFDYRGMVRRLIHLAKIRGWTMSMECLAWYAGSHPWTKELCRRADVLMPAPSSFWGRLRGRQDFAAFLVRRFAGGVHVVHRAPARPFYAGWTKRALQENKADFLPGDVGQWNPVDPARNLRGLRHRRILVVDDIVTSGFTMASVSAGLPPGAHGYLALAAAGDFRGFRGPS